jgi:hypothetical protein
MRLNVTATGIFSLKLRNGRGSIFVERMYTPLQTDGRIIQFQRWSIRQSVQNGQIAQEGRDLASTTTQSIDILRAVWAQLRDRAQQATRSRVLV